MQAAVLIGFLVTLPAALADITGTNPTNGTCLCPITTSTQLKIRSSACGTVIGSASSSKCFTYLGSKKSCALSGISDEFFQLDYWSSEAWAAGKYLKVGSASQCGALAASSGLDDFTNKCLHCICMIESNCNPNIGCRPDRGSLSCGPYQIKQDYWIDCGRLGGGWKECANDMACAERCVRAYMSRYGKRCSGGRNPVCEDYSRIHNGGPSGCKRSSTIGYWNRVKACCGGQSGCD